MKRRNWSFAWRASLVVGVVGVLLSFVVFELMRRQERDRVRERFERIVDADLGYFYVQVARDEEALLSLRTLVHASDGVSLGGEIRPAAAELLARNQGISALEWVASITNAQRPAVEAQLRAQGIHHEVLFERQEETNRVRAGERDHYWPILYVEPMTGNEAVLGYDLRTASTVEDLERARDSGATTVSRRLRLIQEPSRRNSVVVIVPVYQKNAPTGTVDERRAALRGFVQGVYRLEATFSRLLSFRESTPYDLALLDLSAPNPLDRMLFFSPSKLRVRPPAEVPTESFSGAFTINRDVEVGQRQWRFSFRLAPEWVADNSSLSPLLALIIGLVATGGVSGILMVAGRQTQLVESKVAARTGELRVMNSRLESEIAERLQTEAALVDAQRIAQLGRWVSDLSRGTLGWSEETFHIFGQDPARFQPTTDAFYQCVHPDDREGVRTAVRAAVDHGLPYRSLHRVVRPDGSIRHVQENAEVVRDESGRPAQLVGTVLDITERKLAEEALAHERNLLRTLLDGIPDFIFVKDAHNRFLMVNAANARSMNVTDPDAVKGRTDRDFFPAQIAELYLADDQRVMASGQPIINRQEPYSQPDGTTGWFLTSKIPLRDADGRVAGLLGISRDISDRRRVEEALEREHNLLRLLIDSLPDYIYVKDQQGRYLLTNEANRKWLGLTSTDAAIGKTVFELIPEDLAKLYDADDRLVLERGETILNREEPCRRADGESGWLLTTKIPLRDREGRITGVVGVSHDVTERKRLELEREQMDRRLKEAQKLESLGVLAGGVAHDFNNILTVILNNAALARMTPEDSGQVTENLGQIEQAVARAAHLCNQMLAYSGRGRFVVEPVNLSSLVNESVPLLRAAIAGQADLQVSTAENLPLVQADVSQLRQILLNLVLNASDALEDRPGVIRMVTGVVQADAAYLRSTYLSPDIPAGDYVFLEVSDTGCGMSPDTQARIFEPFFTTKFTGRGLGLAAVLGIVRGHRGTIKLTSVPGQGTTFRLLLPVARETVVRSGLPRDGGAARDGGGRVLVVDDEDLVRSVLCRVLKAAGYQTVAAGGGAEAIKLFAQDPQSVAAVLLDLTMPQVDGEQTFRELRRLDPGVRVLLMSGYSEQMATARFVGQGLAGFIQKPFQIAALVEQLKETIANRPSRGSASA